MKPSLQLVALAIALCLGASLVAANDLQTWATVLDCYGKPVDGAVVRISGCVDDFGAGGINTTTVNGVASFLKDAENSIQYCWGSADNFCNFEVVSNPLGLSYDVQHLMIDDAQVTPKGFICSIYECCNPCAPKFDNGTERQEASCTPFMTGPKLVFSPAAGTCAPPVNVGGETCFGWFKPTYNGAQNLSEVTVTSVSFRADQKNDESNVLTSGIYSLSSTPTAPFAYLGNRQGNVRWGWEQLWNLPKGGATVTEAGFMFCGQNKFGGTITAKVTASSIVYEITMGPGTKFTTGDIHVYASCSPLTGNKFAPGQLNCNPATATPPACTTTGQLLASGSQYKATINFSCPKGQLFTAFHLGL